MKEENKVDNSAVANVVAWLITTTPFPWFIAAGCRYGGWVWGPPAVLSLLSVWILTWSIVSARLQAFLDKYDRKAADRLKQSLTAKGEILKKRCPEDPPKRSLNDPIRWAEGLIEQLPETHEGRCTWMVRYGLKEKACKLREEDPRKYEWCTDNECFVEQPKP